MEMYQVKFYKNCTELYTIQSEMNAFLSTVENIKEPPIIIVEEMNDGTFGGMIVYEIDKGVSKK